MLEIRPLPDDLQKVAIEELNEDPTTIESDIENLRNWIDQQPHLRARTDDQFLLTFLRGCKFSLEKAKTKIDKYFMLKTKFPELFNLQLEDEKYLEIIRLGIGSVLPRPLYETGPRIMMVRLGIFDARKYSVIDILRVAQACYEFLMWEDDYAIVNGVITIVDLQKCSKELFFQANPSLIKKMNVYSEGAMPLRPKSSFVINAPSIFESVFNWMRPLMTEKQINRLTVYGTNFEKMYEKIPLKYFPIDYGGENGSLADIAAEWETTFERYKDYFSEDSKYGTDESLRVGSPLDFHSMFGMEGSFRKLNVD